MTNSISIYTREKIARISLFLMFAVFVIHANTIFFLPQDSFLQQFQFFVVNGLCRAAVPMFFLISGFLFFYKTGSNFSIKCYMEKSHSRFFSLLLPLLLYWSIFLFLFEIIYIIKTGGNFNIENIKLNAFTAIKTIYHCWFLRDLLFFVLCSPLIFVAVQHLKIWSVIIAVIFHLVFPHLGFFDTDGIAWFMLGAYFGICKFAFISIKLSFFVTISTGIAWVLLCACLSWKIIPASYGICFLRNALGIVFIWSGYDWFCHTRDSSESKFLFYLDRWSTFAFFLYLFHEPLMSSLRKAIVMLGGANNHSAGYWGLVWLVLIVVPWMTLILIARIWKSKHLASYHLFSGRR